jgi:hypothetical protein
MPGARPTSTLGLAGRTRIGTSKPSGLPPRRRKDDARIEGPGRAPVDERDGEGRRGRRPPAARSGGSEGGRNPGSSAGIRRGRCLHASVRRERRKRRRGSPRPPQPRRRTTRGSSPRTNPSTRGPTASGIRPRRRTTAARWRTPTRAAAPLRRPRRTRRRQADIGRGAVPSSCRDGRSPAGGHETEHGRHTSLSVPAAAEKTTTRGPRGEGAGRGRRVADLDGAGPSATALGSRKFTLRLLLRSDGSRRI